MRIAGRDNFEHQHQDIRLIVSVGFFITYHIVSVTAEKMVKESEISVTEGMWVANFILLPVGLFLSYKANTDSQLFSFPSIKQLFIKNNYHNTARHW